jgi:hypothetical protein
MRQMGKRKPPPDAMGAAAVLSHFQLKSDVCEELLPILTLWSFFAFDIWESEEDLLAEREFCKPVSWVKSAVFPKEFATENNVVFRNG